jgi:predicted dehydrogenase
MDHKLRAGIIGTGGIARSHIRELSGHREVVVQSLSDPSQEAIRKTTEAFPDLDACTVYDDYTKMLAHEELDAVLVCSPHHVHAEQITTCLRAGLHVLAEKPMVCSVEEAHRVMTAEQEAGKLLGIAYQRHGQGEFRFIRDHIRNGDAGKVQFVCALQGQNWLAGTRGSWRQDPAVSCGGQLNDSGSHLIDIILWTTGLRAKRVSAVIERFDSQVDIDSAIIVEFAEGATASISVVGNCPVFWEDITVVCSDWSFFMRKGELTYSIGQRREVHKLVSTPHQHDSPARSFVEAVLGRGEVLAPSVCGLRTIELTEAAWASAATGQPVGL